MSFANSLIVASCLSLLFIAGCASDPSTHKQQQVAQEAVDRSDPNAVRCEKVTRTGTRIGEKVCKTNSQWDEEARASREATETAQRRGAHTNVGN